MPIPWQRSHASHFVDRQLAETAPYSCIAFWDLLDFFIHMENCEWKKKLVLFFFFFFFPEIIAKPEHYLIIIQCKICERWDVLLLNAITPALTITMSTCDVRAAGRNYENDGIMKIHNKNFPNVRSEHIECVSMDFSFQFNSRDIQTLGSWTAVVSTEPWNVGGTIFPAVLCELECFDSTSCAPDWAHIHIHRQSADYSVSTEN